MPIHMLAWAESLASVTSDSLTTVNDPIIPTSNGLFLLNKNYNLFGVMGMGTTLSRLAIVQPSIRVICDDFVRPINLTLLPGDNAPIADYRSKPFPLAMNENLDLQATTSAAGPAVTSALAWINSDRSLMPLPGGNIYTLRGTSTTTAIVNTWTLQTMTWQNTLPQGSYYVVGMEAIGTTCKGARLIFPNQIERPGCAGLASLGIRTYDGWFRKGGLGIWGQFTNWNFPQVEAFCGSADTALEVYLDLVPMFTV